jgi:hypothetical protein
MAHYAFLDENNIVTEVIPGKDEDETIEGLTPEEWYADFRGQKCVRTSYNGRIRYNYAGIGYTYDPIDDAFIAPMPCDHTELTLNDFKRWECAACEATSKQFSDPA